MSTGSFRKGKDGKWEYHISAGRDPRTGKYRQVHRRGFATKKEAIEDADQERKRLGHVGYKANARLTFPDYATEWLEGFALHNTKGKPLAQSTKSTYEIILYKHLIPAFQRTKMRDLKKTHIKGYITRKRQEGCAETTIKHHYRLLALIADSAVDDGLLPHNVVTREKSPQATKARDQASFIDEAGQAALLTTAKDWITQERRPLRVNTGLATYLALMTGMRRGELLGLKWSDVVTRVDKDGKTRSEIHVQRAVEIKDKSPNLKAPKSDAGYRNIAISRRVATVLSQHRLWQRRYASWLANDYQDVGLILPGDYGALLAPHALSKRFEGLAKIAKSQTDNGQLATLHSLRHTAISNWIKAGINAKAVRERAGHSSITVTMDTYGHLFESLSADQIEDLDGRILDRIGGR